MRIVEVELKGGLSVDIPGPRLTVIRSGRERHREPRVIGSTVGVLLDAAVPGSDMYGGFNVLAPGARIPLHWHSVGECQFILSGTGLVVDSDGVETPVEPHSMVFSPRGEGGAHGFINTGQLPLTILFVYGSPDGASPDFNVVASGDMASLRQPSPRSPGPSSSGLRRSRRGARGHVDGC
jgi:uncharacterized cupin superfamily protein